MKKSKAKRVQPCMWFAKCRNAATGVTPHSILGDVPTCDRCHKFATGQDRKKNPSRPPKGTKAYIRRASEATKKSPTKRLRKRRTHNRVRRTFPNPAPKGFALYARKGSGPKLHYNGRSFTDNDKPVVFPTTKSADDTGKFLIDAYPLLKQYALTVEPAIDRPPK